MDPWLDGSRVVSKNRTYSLFMCQDKEENEIENESFRLF